jgi:hypothetical protein
MHYPAAERALMLLNSDMVQRIVVKGLLRGSQQQHWNQSVTTVTFSVIRTYMEMNRSKFEDLTVKAQQE